MHNVPPISERTLLRTYERALSNAPDAIAQMDTRGRVVTFEESWSRSLRIAKGLRELGVGRQETVALMTDNSLDACAFWTGIGLGGGIEVPVNSAYKGAFLTHIVNDSGAAVLIIEDKYVERVEAVIDKLPNLTSVVVRGEVEAAVALRAHCAVLSVGELESHGHAQPEHMDAGDLLAYMYTSGTTGMSKGVLASHAHAYTYSTREDYQQGVPREGDRLLVTLPLFHIAGQWYGTYQALIHAVPAVISDGFSATSYWQTTREYETTMTTMVGAMAELLLRQPESEDDADNPMQFAVMAPVPQDRLRFSKRFAVDVESAYGMSEVGAVCHAEVDGPTTGVGRPRNGYDLRLVDERGRDVATGEIGELWVKPEHELMTFSGYHNLPDKTAESIVDGWIHTGDAFRRDEDGFFHFSDRIKDSLRRRGENISSLEVEKVINEYPAIFESAVVAVPSEVSEDEIKAVLTVREGMSVDLNELMDYLIEKLPYFMVPRYVEIVDEMPRTPTQKIRKGVLRERGVTDSVWDREAAGIKVRRG